MEIGAMPGIMTPEFGNALIVIDGVAIGLFVLIFYAAKIAAGSSRVWKLLGVSILISRFRLWRLTHKAH
jgi:hypothetical protein